MKCTKSIDAMGVPCRNPSIQDEPKNADIQRIINTGSYGRHTRFMFYKYMCKTYNSFEFCLVRIHSKCDTPKDGHPNRMSSKRLYIKQHSKEADIGTLEA